MDVQRFIYWSRGHLLMKSLQNIVQTWFGPRAAPFIGQSNFLQIGKKTWEEIERNP